LAHLVQAFGLNVTATAWRYRNVADHKCNGGWRERRDEPLHHQDGGVALFVGGLNMS
jgi:hypothetical protein